MNQTNVRSRVNVEALQDLCIALLLLEEDAQFDLGTWASRKKPESPQLNCGTVACAIGLGSTLPSWRKAGFRLVRSDFIPQFGVYMSWYAVKNFLGISMAEAEYLFLSLKYPQEDRKDPKAVAKRIWNFLNETG